MKASVVRDVYDALSFMLDEVEITDVNENSLSVIYTFRDETFRTVFVGNGVSYTSKANGEGETMRFEEKSGSKFTWDLKAFFNLKKYAEL